MIEFILSDRFCQKCRAGCYYRTGVHFDHEKYGPIPDYIPEQENTTDA